MFMGMTDKLAERFGEAGGSGLPMVKICGFRDRANAVEIASMEGVGMIGLNFWPQSKRYISPAEAGTWVADLPADVLRIGVCVDAAAADMRGWVESGLVDAVQLHGDESPELCQQLVDSGIPFIKAFGLAGPETLESVARYPGRMVLFDAHAPLERGGTGRTTDWNLLRQWMDSNPDYQVTLSGGLSPDNIANAITTVRPSAVDCASGVETEPGLKDPAKVRRLLVNARLKRR